MYIEPQTNIRLLKDVPLDTSYDHTIYFATRTAQFNYFVGKQKYDLRNYTYQRVNRGVARVGLKADLLYDCNYMMFQNTAYGDRWFYAFITKIEYVNDVTANVEFELDDMQTWHFDYSVDYCFVEREHVIDDTIGAHIEPENLECGEYVFNNWNKYDPLLELAVIVAIVDVSVGDQTQSASGNLYDNIYSGASLYIFEAEDVEGLNEFVTSFVQKPDAIVSMYIAPMFLFAHAGAIDPEYLSVISISEGKTCDYTIGSPINVRLANDYDLSDRVYVTAGSTYELEIENTGSNLSFRIVGADSDNIVRQVAQVVAPEGSTTHQFTAGEGVSYIRLTGSDTLSNANYILFRPDSDYIFDIPPDHRLPDIPVGARDYFRGGAITTQATLDGYKPKNNKLYTYPYNFFHIDNGSGSELQLRYEFFRELDPIIEITGTVTQPVVVTARPVAYKNVGDDDNEFIGNRMLSTETLTLDKFPLCSWNTDAYKAWVAQNAIPIGIGMASTVVGGMVASILNPLAGAVGLGTSIGQVSNLLTQGYQASIKADIMGGNYGNGNANIPYGMLTFFYGRCSVSAQYARIIDDYFNMFGYGVKRCKVPNRNARPHWNYVKTVGCTLTGSVPADSMKHLCQIYDHGITFWNNGDEIGQYNLNNSIT